MNAELAVLLKYLPPRIAKCLDHFGQDLIELALDLGRPPVARVVAGYRVIDNAPVTRDELDSTIALVGQFKRNNRAGLERTLHRLSVIRNRYGDPVGLTARVGRHLGGLAAPLQEILLNSRDSLLLIGPPGAGKTTLLRDCARVLSERLGPAVLVVDSHNEIGGDGDLPHSAIGAARRLQVPDATSPFPAAHYEMMLEAIRNHFPDVVIVDEIMTRQEAEAARTIARRGVRLIATAHGETLTDIVHNPELCPLVGGAAAIITLSEGRRPELPIIQRAIAIRRDRTIGLYHNVAEAVDTILGGDRLEPDVVLTLPVAQEQQRPQVLTLFG